MGSAIPHLNKELFFNLIFPLAPIEEQKRIVEIIDKQFAKLDEARDLIQKSLDSFADRKSSILHKAFAGELTKKWRELRHKQFNWENKKLSEVCPLITDGTHQTPTYTDESGYIFLSSKNVRTGVIDWDNIKYIPESLHEELYSRLAPRKDDILLAKNGTTGIAAIVDRDCVFDIYVSLALIRPNILEVIPKYLLYAISTPEVKQYFDSSLKGIGVPNLHLKYIRETIIPIPSLDEQEEIVRILDSIFEKEDRSKELIDMLDKIDEMKKSILARAFRGELGTSNPTDEPATDLLRKILGEKEE
ncbi:MAG: restriction endonuclease subunit S [Bacilli bacterium]|nr:restriction endonuclease subunit S [Bacilli bacterium]